MSRVVISDKGKMIFYIEDYLIGSTGYLIDYTKLDSSKNMSCQCKIKIIDYMIFGTIKNSKKYRFNLKKEYPGKNYKQFIIWYSDRVIVACAKIISDWEIDLLSEKEIQNIILYGRRSF